MSAVRTSIVNELKRRVYTIDESLKVVEGTGGFWGKWAGQLPVIHFFENAAERELTRKGLYKIEWSVQIEFVNRWSNDRNDLYDEGRRHLDELQSAIEIDERFTCKDTGKDLVAAYFMAADEIVEVTRNVVNTAAIYNFIFFEEFGYTDPSCGG